MSFWLRLCRFLIASLSLAAVAVQGWFAVFHLALRADLLRGALGNASLP